MGKKREFKQFLNQFHSKRISREAKFDVELHCLGNYAAYVGEDLVLPSLEVRLNDDGREEGELLHEEEPSSSSDDDMVADMEAIIRKHRGGEEELTHDELMTWWTNVNANTPGLRAPASMQEYLLSDPVTAAASRDILMAQQYAEEHYRAVWKEGQHKKEVTLGYTEALEGLQETQKYVKLLQTQAAVLTEERQRSACPSIKMTHLHATATAKKKLASAAAVQGVIEEVDIESGRCNLRPDLTPEEEEDLDRRKKLQGQGELLRTSEENQLKEIATTIANPTFDTNIQRCVEYVEGRIETTRAQVNALCDAQLVVLKQVTQQRDATVENLLTSEQLLFDRLDWNLETLLKAQKQERIAQQNQLQNSRFATGVETESLVGKVQSLNDSISSLRKCRRRVAALHQKKLDAEQEWQLTKQQRAQGGGVQSAQPPFTGVATATGVTAAGVVEMKEEEGDDVKRSVGVGRCGELANGMVMGEDDAGQDNGRVVGKKYEVRRQLLSQELPPSRPQGGQKQQRAVPPSLLTSLYSACSMLSDAASSVVGSAVGASDPLLYDLAAVRSSSDDDDFSDDDADGEEKEQTQPVGEDEPQRKRSRAS